MPRWTLLRHDLPDGSSHLDLLLAPDDAVDPAARPDERRLLTFRLAKPPDAGAVGPTPVERTPDHRALYLDHEGPVSGDRGHVRRVDSGTWRPERITPDEVVGLLRLGGTTRRLRLTRLNEAGGWSLEVASADSEQ